MTTTWGKTPDLLAIGGVMLGISSRKCLNMGLIKIQEARRSIWEHARWFSTGAREVSIITYKHSELRRPGSEYLTTNI